jgi:hypothetical protein
MATQTANYIHPQMINRQNQEFGWLKRIYEAHAMPIGVEQKNFSSAQIAAAIGVEDSVGFRKFIQTIEKLGIVNRRFEYGGKTGRQSHTTLLVDRDESLARLTGHQEAEKNESNRPPVRRKASNVQPIPQSQSMTDLNGEESIKTRIMLVLQDGKVYKSPGAIMEAIRRPGENIDLHNLTHQLHDLQRLGRLTFVSDRRGRGAHKQIGTNPIPHNIHITRDELKRLSQAKNIDKAAREMAAMPVMSEAVTSNPWTIPMATENDIEDLEVTVKVEEVKAQPMTEVSLEEITGTPDPWTQYPDIAKIVKRREYLEQAAQLAENANEDDLAIVLLERSAKPMAPVEDQAIKLFNAYLECKANHG